MITAYGDAETKRRALENGAEALLTKPIDFGTLRSEIDMRAERAARAHGLGRCPCLNLVDFAALHESVHDVVDGARSRQRVPLG